MEIFVYGANTQGRHGKGAAKYALEHHGAVYGKVGLQGNSYGIITKELRPNYPAITVADLAINVAKLIKACKDNPEHTFRCTPFGTGLAGFSHETMKSIMSLFIIPPNLILPEEWN